MFAKIRQISLWVILILTVGQTGYQHYVPRSWQSPLEVIIHPVSMSDDPSVQAYIDSLSAKDFEVVEKWFTAQATAHGRNAITPFKFTLAAQLDDVPPLPPAQSNPLEASWYSMRLRGFATSQNPETLTNWRQIHIYLIVHPATSQKNLHSIALRRGLVAMVQARGDRSRHDKNMVILAHELLHTVGATDKYDLLGNPRFPDGFGDPNQLPLYPQKIAEISAAQIAIRPGLSMLAADINATVVGDETALEIGWR